MKKKGFWSCCSAADTFENENADIQKIQIELPEIKVEKLHYQKLYYWSGFRERNAPVSIKELDVNVPKQIEIVTGTETSMIFLLEDGTLWQSQLNSEITSPMHPNHLDLGINTKIAFVTSGKYHSLALDQNGTLYSWGSNRFGQLGLNLSADELAQAYFPTLVKSMASETVVQIAAGENHSVCLTILGDIYTCGLNTDGQLGTKHASGFTTIFMKLQTVSGVPWNFIASCGDNTYALTIHGDIWGWGNNSKAQLGIFETPESTLTPQWMGYHTYNIIAGKHHKLDQTIKRNICMARGSNKFNQIGPIFDEGHITQVVAGDYHTLVIGNGNLYCYGPELNDSEKDIEYEGQPAPIPVQVPNGMSNYKIFAFGTTSIILPTNGVDNPYSGDILQLTEQLLDKYISVDGPIEPGLEKRFRNEILNVSIWNGSFRRGPVKDIQPSKNEFPDKEYFGYQLDFLQAESFIRKLWSMKSSKLQEMLRHQIDNWLHTFGSYCNSEIHREYFTLVAYIPLHIFNNPANQIQSIRDPVGDLFSRMLNILSPGIFPVPSCIPTGEYNYLKLFATWYAKRIKDYAVHVMDLIFYCYDIQQLERFITALKQVVVTSMTITDEKGEPVGSAVEELKPVFQLLHSVWRRNRKQKRLSNYSFCIPKINTFVNLTMEFAEWIQKKALIGTRIAPPRIAGAYLCDYPFIFDSSAKASLLESEQQFQVIGAAMISRLVEPVANQEFVLSVHRDSLVKDVLQQIPLFDAFDFKKRLRVEFIGEEGQDAGGVTKEFFLLLMRQFQDFCEERGLISYNDESKLAWFTPISEEDENELELLEVFGVLCGLAIYNKTIIKLPFPSALYKKILGEDCDIEDLIEISPTEGKSLKQVLEYAEDDIESAFGLTFEIIKKILGVSCSIELKPDGRNIPVTLENRSEFVELYIKQIFETGVSPSFSNFKRGFDNVFQESFVIKFLSPDELKEIIIGNEDYDWGCLQEECQYEGVFHPEHATISLFWEIFHELDANLKTKFLLFLTGSDRVPISGMKAIKITINSTPQDESHFPVAHTCFNLLDMPAYNEKEILKEKLLTAIEHSEGFSIA